MKVTPTLRAEFERRRKAGESCARIAQDYDVATSTIRDHTKHLGVYASSKPRRAINYAEAPVLVRKHGVAETARIFGVGVPAIYRALRVERRGYA